MLSVTASLSCLCAIITIAIGWCCARSILNRARRIHVELDEKIADLHALVEQSREQSTQLAALLAQAQHLKPHRPSSALTKIEALADPAALENAASMAHLVAELPSPRTGLPAGLFADNRQSLAIARLADQGLSAAEIARRLGVPIGEIELRLSLRAA
jgi:hypothetical protein